MAAKSGTAQRGEGRTNNGIFICYAPYDDPEIAVAIVVARAQAGSNLIGIAKDVLDSYFALSSDTSSPDHENTLLQ